MKKSLIRLLAFVLVFLAPRVGSTQEAVEMVSKQGLIPNTYNTYTLFLVCNPQWLAPAKADSLYDLYRQFKIFGKVIGQKNAALWFWKSRLSAHDPALVDNVDVERSVRFCEAWNLRPSEGPHLVITTVYPDEAHLSSGLPKGSAVYGLANMDPKAISDLLAKLTDVLVGKGQVDSPTETTATPLALWVRLLDATQRTINSFGCAWTFKIDAGPVSADLRACKNG